MLMPSTITALRTRRYDSTWYIPGAIHEVENDPMDGGRRYDIQPPFVSDLSAHVVQFNSADYTGCTFSEEQVAQPARVPSDALQFSF